MGKLRVIKVGPLSTIQDEGRFGYRQYGIPQSGAMDIRALHNVNHLVSNGPGWPVIETAIQGIKLEALEETTIAVTGAITSIEINDQQLPMNTSHQLSKGDILTISKPLDGVYSYLGIGGKLKANEDFGSTSTYLMAGFGGIEGRALKKGDVLETKEGKPFENHVIKREIETKEVETIRIMKGPEWKLLKDLPERTIFQVDPSSNRMGIRLIGNPLDMISGEVLSSAVIPGTIQLPPNGIPLILMNDCQTTGGYPRIGKVVEEDMGRLAQLNPMHRLRLKVIAFEDGTQKPLK